MHEPAGVVEILVQILQNIPYSEVQFQNTPPHPKMKIVRESKSKSFRIPPPKWKLSESPSLRVSEYPPKRKLSESPSPRVSEYPPQMKIVRESKSKSFRIPISEYQWETMCGKLPHVETLSNPDNYSLKSAEYNHFSLHRMLCVKLASVSVSVSVWVIWRITNRHSVKYAELRIGRLLKVCRFLIRHTMR